MTSSYSYRQALGFIAQHKATVAFIVFAVFSIVLIWGEATATNYLNSHTQQLRTEQSRLLSQINSIPRPADMEKGIINSQSRFVIDTTATSHEEMIEISDQLGFGYRHLFVSLISREYETNELRAINREIDEITQDIDKEISSYSQNLSAMTNFIEYNPRVDTTDLSLGSSDSNERMDRLRTGLSTAIDEIEQLTSSEFHDQTLRVLRDAQSAQTELENTGEIEDFVDTIEELQNEYIQLTIDKYELILPQIRQQAISINRKL